MISNQIISEDIQLIINKFPSFEKLRNKTVLISGASGFLPAYLVETFMSLNPEYNINVIGLVRNLEKAITRFDHWRDNPRLKLISHNVELPYFTSDRIDYIIHAASQASPVYYGVDPVGTLNANILGTINLLNLAKTKHVESFLFFSSGEVYGEVSVNDIPIKEDTFGYLNPTLLRSCYGESKRMAENICVSYFSQYGVKTKIVRPFHTYGPGMSLNDGRVFADFVSDVLKKRNITIHSDGKAKRAFCYLSDATLGFLTVLLNGESGQSYNVGNPNEEHSIEELANIISCIYPELGISVVKELPETESINYLKSTISRNSPAIEKIFDLGWKPTISAQVGFKRTIDSFNVGLPTSNK